MRLHWQSEGSGARTVVFLHGLAGHCGEWAASAHALADRFRTIRIDQRAHGRSTRNPADLSRIAFADDIAAIIDTDAVTLVGQSMGAHTALLVADRHPDRVAHLIMVEGDVGGGGEQPLTEVTQAISSWPSSFPSYDAVRDFFGGDNPAGRAWADGYEERDGRWWPLFDPTLTAEIMRPVFAAERWDVWDRLTCRVDLVLGENSAIDQNRVDLMCARRPEAGRHVVPGAGHDVHLDQPDHWIALLERLL